jgi:hypothetical protein
MSEKKSYFGLTIEFMDKFSAASEEEQSEMLTPMAAVMMWDARMMDDNGMDNNQSKRFWDLAFKDGPFGEELPPAFKPAQPGGINLVEVERAGLTEQLMEMIQIVEDSKSARDILQPYIKKLEAKRFGKYYNEFFAEFFPSIAKELRERMVEDAAQFDQAELISGRPAPDPLPHPLLEVEKILKERRVERGGRIFECFAAIERTDQQTKALEKLFFRTGSDLLEKPQGI